MRNKIKTAEINSKFIRVLLDPKICIIAIASISEQTNLLIDIQEYYSLKAMRYWVCPI